MARKITDKQLYKLKNDELKAMFTQVTPYEFYRDVFPAGSLGVHGDLSVRKPNLIYTMTVRKDAADEKAKVYARNTIVFDDLEGLQGAAGAEFAVTSPVSYRGRNRTAANAYHLWGFCIDLDGVGMDQMHDLLYQIQNDVLPTPTYLINSGHGFHVYYLLEEPIPLYKHLHRPLNDLKHGLTRIVWNAYTSNIEPEKRQFQGIFQGFRMPGSQSKLGKRYPVVAFRVGEKTTIETLNRYVDDQYHMTDADGYRMPLEEAKVKYPEWYQKRVVEGDRSRKKWDIAGKVHGDNPYALYDWWIAQMRKGAFDGNRYCIQSKTENSESLESTDPTYKTEYNWENLADWWQESREDLMDGNTTKVRSVADFAAKYKNDESQEQRLAGKRVRRAARRTVDQEIGMPKTVDDFAAALREFDTAIDADRDNREER